MSIITRSEAAHRLKLASSAVNIAVSSVREGYWKQAVQAAVQAVEELDRLMPHLEEAADDEAVRGPSTPRYEPEPLGSLKYGTPPPTPKKKSKDDWTPSKPKIVVDESWNRPKPSTVIPTKPKPTPVKPIVTPPPPVKQLEETRTFDLSRMSGQEAYYRKLLQDNSLQVDWEMTEAFDRLSPDQQAEIVKRYNETKQPVTLSE